MIIESNTDTGTLSLIEMRKTRAKHGLCILITLIALSLILSCINNFSTLSNPFITTPTVACALILTPAYIFKDKFTSNQINKKKKKQEQENSGPSSTSQKTTTPDPSAASPLPPKAQGLLTNPQTSPSLTPLITSTTPSSSTPSTASPVPTFNLPTFESTTRATPITATTPSLTLPQSSPSVVDGSLVIPKAPLVMRFGSAGNKDYLEVIMESQEKRNEWIQSLRAKDTKKFLAIFNTSANGCHVTIDQRKENSPSLIDVLASMGVTVDSTSSATVSNLPPIHPPTDLPAPSSEAPGLNRSVLTNIDQFIGV